MFYFNFRDIGLALRFRGETLKNFTIWSKLLCIMLDNIAQYETEFDVGRSLEG